MPPAPLPTHGRSEGVRVSPPSCPRTQALRQLAYLRVLAPLTQALTLAVVMRYFDVHIYVAGVSAVLALEALVALATAARLRMAQPVSEAELFAQAQLDVLLFAGILYFTGGTTNPFGPLFVLPMIIASSALRPRWVWAMAGTTIVAYVLLRTYHVALSHPHGHTQVYELHEDGMVVNYLITAALLAFFCNRMQATLRRSQLQISDARDRQMRNESASAIGALAAGCAHELGSPLGTMAIVVSELQRQSAAESSQAHDLRIVAEQIAECKRIVSKLAHAGGVRRAESATAVRLDRFVEAAVARARALHPGMTIHSACACATPAPLIVGEETLTQAIVDLIHHATLLTDDQVEVSCAWNDADLQVQVTHQGAPYPRDLVRRLLQQLPAPAEQPGPDLYLAQATLERLGGRIQFADHPPRGALARLVLPRRSIAVDPATSPEHGHADVGR